MEIDTSCEHSHVCVNCGEHFECSNYRCQKRRYALHPNCLKSAVSEFVQQTKSVKEPSKEVQPKLFQ